jgi:hypothetical protein
LRTSATSPPVDLAVLVAEGGDGSAVEDPSFHGSPLEHGALGRVELVEAGGEERLDRRRHLHGPVAAVADEGEHLLEEERVALGGLHDPLAQGICHAAELAEQLLGLAGIERLEENGGRVPLAAAPGWPTLEQLRPGHAEQQDRCVPGEVGDMLDQIQKRVLGPVHIVEHANHGL